MPPGGGREDPFVLKYLLTITAAAVAETGEVYSGIKPPEYIACLHCLDSPLSFLSLTHPFITPLHPPPTHPSGPQTYPLQVSSLPSQGYPTFYFLCLIVPSHIPLWFLGPSPCPLCQIPKSLLSLSPLCTPVFSSHLLFQ